MNNKLIRGWLLNAAIRLALIGLGIAMATGVAKAASAVGDGAPHGVPRYRQGEVLVRYHSDHALADPGRGRADVDPPGLRRRRLWGLQRLDGRPVELIRDLNRTTAELITAYARLPGVESVTPNYLRTTQQLKLPDDPLFPQQWGLWNTGQTVGGLTGTPGVDIKAPAAWPLSRETVSPVVIAVIDTGVDFLHPDLAAHIWTNPGEQAGSGQDDDGNGYIDDYYGWDFSGDDTAIDGIGNPGPDNYPMDNDGHGTHVAGIAAAITANGAGIAGVAEARIMTLKASPDGLSMPLADSLEAIAYAIMMKTDYNVPIVVINASYGAANSYSAAERDLIAAAGNAGIIFCAAAGNSGSNNDIQPFYPASYELPNVLSVAAIDATGNLAGFSNYGATRVHLAAPGVAILSALPTFFDTAAAVSTESAGVYASDGLLFAGYSAGVTGMVYDCGLGYPNQFPSEVAGKIALIERGDLTFYEKTRNAMTAGAAAVVIYNHEPGLFFGQLAVPGPWIPAVSISREDGMELQGSLPATVTVMHQPNSQNAYDLVGGTSMATPFVSGAVAFLAQQFPQDNTAARIQRLLDNVEPAATLATKVSSGGYLNLQRAVDSDADGLPDWWELDWVGNLYTLSAGSDYDENGFPDRHEYLAGTDPTDPDSALAIVALDRDDGDFPRIAWQSASNRVYIVERAVTANGPYLPVSGSLVATPPVNEWFDITAPAGNNAYFYRVRLDY